MRVLVKVLKRHKEKIHFLKRIIYVYLFKASYNVFNDNYLIKEYNSK